MSVNFVFRLPLVFKDLFKFSFHENNTVITQAWPSKCQFWVRLCEKLSCKIIYGGKCDVASMARSLKASQLLGRGGLLLSVQQNFSTLRQISQWSAKPGTWYIMGQFFSVSLFVGLSLPPSFPLCLWNFILSFLRKLFKNKRLTSVIRNISLSYHPYVNRLELNCHHVWSELNFNCGLMWSERSLLFIFKRRDPFVRGVRAEWFFSVSGFFGLFMVF